MNDNKNKPRVPQTLQTVFLASNRGKDILKPPPEKVAYKIFLQSWWQSHEDKGEAGSRMNRDKHGSKVWNNLMKKKNQSSANKSIHETYFQSPSLGVSNTSGTCMEPQKYLEAMLKTRGYSTSTFKTLDTAYYNQPTKFQQASYHVYLINLLRENNIEGLKEIMNSGISTNPCNNFGESLLHNICRRGNEEALDIMIDCGSSIQVSDDYGRTPLHDACWAPSPCFKVVERLVKIDRRLFFMEDVRGALPLSYAAREQWASWIEFLDSRKDEFFPSRDIIREGPEPVPKLVSLGPNSMPIPEPKNCLTVELAAMVASGRMKPIEAELLRDDDSDDESSTSDSDYSGESAGSYGSDESTSYSDSESDSDYDEMDRLLLLGFSVL